MVALRGVCDGASGKERAAQERQPVGILLKNAEVDVQRHAGLRMVSERGKDLSDLGGVRDFKDELAAALLRRLGIKGKAKGLFE